MSSQRQCPLLVENAEEKETTSPVKEFNNKKIVNVSTTPKVTTSKEIANKKKQTRIRPKIRPNWNTRPGGWGSVVG